jgi:hypothetical protein
MAVNNYSVYDMFAQIKERAERGKRWTLARLARNLKPAVGAGRRKDVCGVVWRGDGERLFRQRNAKDADRDCADRVFVV